MAITAVPYGLAYRNLGKGLLDFTTHTFKVCLTSSSYVPDVDNHEFRSSITEISGVGYILGGATLTGLGWTFQAANDRCLLTANNVVWNNASFTARRAVVYRSTGNAVTDILVSYVDFGADAVSVNTPFTLTFPNGVFALKTTP